MLQNLASRSLVHPSACLCICLPVCLYVSWSIGYYVCLPTCLYLSVHLPISIHFLDLFLPASLPVCLNPSCHLLLT